MTKEEFIKSCDSGYHSTREFRANHVALACMCSAVGAFHWAWVMNDPEYIKVHNYLHSPGPRADGELYEPEQEETP